MKNNMKIKAFGPPAAKSYISFSKSMGFYKQRIFPFANRCFSTTKVYLPKQIDDFLKTRICH